MKDIFKPRIALMTRIRAIRVISAIRGLKR
jgi:hypothetical protein